MRLNGLEGQSESCGQLWDCRWLMISHQSVIMTALPSWIWTKLGSYIVPAEILIHSNFQHSMLYGFRMTFGRL